MWAQGRKQPSLRPQLVVPTALGLRESRGGAVSGRGPRECHGPPDSQNCHLASRAHPSHPAVSDLWPKRLGHKL